MSKIFISTEVLAQELDGETVLLDLASENYFGLNPVGARIWQLIGDGATLQAVFDALVAEFDAEPERIRADLLALIDELAKGKAMAKILRSPEKA